MLSLRSTLSSCALFALAAIPSCAAVITYNDLTSFLNASSSLSTVTFDGLAAQGSTTNYSTGTGLLIPGAEFTGYLSATAYQLYVANPSPNTFDDFHSGSVLTGPVYYSGSGSYTPYINIALSTPVTAAGFDLMTTGGTGVSFNITLNNMPTVYTSLPTGARPSQTFFGFTSDAPINSIQLSLPASASGITPVLDNFSYGSEGDPGQTPELCTFLLIASGLIGLRIFRRRLRGLAGLPA